MGDPLGSRDLGIWGVGLGFWNWGWDLGTQGWGFSFGVGGLGLGFRVWGWGSGLAGLAVLRGLCQPRKLACVSAQITLNPIGVLERVEGILTTTVKGTLKGSLKRAVEMRSAAWR